MEEIIIAPWFAGNDPVENNSVMQEQVDSCWNNTVE